MQHQTCFVVLQEGAKVFVEGVACAIGQSRIENLSSTIPDLSECVQFINLARISYQHEVSAKAVDWELLVSAASVAVT